MTVALPMHRLHRWCLTSAVAGGAVWGLQLVLVRPDPFDRPWAEALLLLAVLVLVPLGLRLAAREGQQLRAWTWRTAVRLQLPAALLLAGAFQREPGPLAAALAVPWLGVTVLVAFFGLGRLREGGIASPGDVSVCAGLVYLAIGGGWTVLSRLGAQPLDFEPIIVLLTAIHFHHAGFVLPLLTGLAAQTLAGAPLECGLPPARWSTALARLTVALVVASVPLVAVGITATQLGLTPFVETAAALLMSLGGLLAAGLHLRLAVRPGRPAVIRMLWAVAAVSLTGGMVLATLYGLRFFGVTPGLDIPWMRALHGTANALGFGLAGALAWTLARR